MPEYGKIQKVTLEFENVILTVEGENAVMWKTFADGQAALAYVHGSRPTAPNWTVTEKDNGTNQT